MYYIAKDNTEERTQRFRMVEIPKSTLKKLKSEQENDNDPIIYIPENESQSVKLIREATTTEIFLWEKRNSSLVVSIDGVIGSVDIMPELNSETKIVRAIFCRPYSTRETELWQDAREQCTFTIRKATRQEVEAFSQAMREEAKIKALRSFLINKPSEQTVVDLERKLLEAKMAYRKDAEKWIEAEDNWEGLFTEYKQKTEAQTKELERYAYIDKVHVHDDLTVSVLTKPLAIERIRGEEAERYEEKIQLPVEVGVFEIEFNLIGVNGVYIRSGHQEHPHISGDTICLGNMRDTAINALQDNDILTAMEIVHEVLTTFACDNPYWHCRELLGLD